MLLLEFLQMWDTSQCLLRSVEITHSAAFHPFNISAELLTQVNRGEGDGCGMSNGKMGWFPRFSSTWGSVAQPGVYAKLE